MDKSAVMSGQVVKGNEPLTSRISHEPVSADHCDTMRRAINGLRQVLPANGGRAKKS